MITKKTSYNSFQFKYMLVSNVEIETKTVNR